MTVLVTGARGVLGRRVAAELHNRGHEVRTAGKTESDVRLDVASGEGIAEAVDGVDAVFHCATDPRRHRTVDAAGTGRLLDAAGARFVFPSIVGCDVIPLGYYRSKLAAEERVASHGPQNVIVRATQFHQLAWVALSGLSRSPVMAVPNDTRLQVLDPSSLAGRMIDAFERGERGRLDDVGGRFAYDVRDLARSYLAATGRRRPVVRINVPGIMGAAFRAGGNLTPNRDERGESWNEFVARRTRAQPG